LGNVEVINRWTASGMFLIRLGRSLAGGSRRRLLCPLLRVRAHINCSRRRPLRPLANAFVPWSHHQLEFDQFSSIFCLLCDHFHSKVSCTSQLPGLVNCHFLGCNSHEFMKKLHIAVDVWEVGYFCHMIRTSAPFICFEAPNPVSLFPCPLKCALILFGSLGLVSPTRVCSTCMFQSAHCGNLTVATTGSSRAALSLDTDIWSWPWTSL